MSGDLFDRHAIGGNSPPEPINDIQPDGLPESDVGGLHFRGNVYAISRDLHEHPIVGAGQPVPPDDKGRPAYSKMEAFTDLLRRAVWHTKQVNIMGEQVYLARGDLIGGRRGLALDWNWSEKRVRGFMAQLVAHEIIHIREAQTHENKAENSPQNKGQGVALKKGQGKGQGSGQLPNVISLCNYDKFQFPLGGQGQGKGQGSGQGGDDEKGHILKTSKNLLTKSSTRTIDSSAPASDDDQPFGISSDFVTVSARELVVTYGDDYKLRLPVRWVAHMVTEDNPHNELLKLAVSVLEGWRARNFRGGYSRDLERHFKNDLEKSMLQSRREAKRVDAGDDYDFIGGQS